VITRPSKRSSPSAAIRHGCADQRAVSGLALATRSQRTSTSPGHGCGSSMQARFSRLASLAAPNYYLPSIMHTASVSYTGGSTGAPFSDAARVAARPRFGRARCDQRCPVTAMEEVERTCCALRVVMEAGADVGGRLRLHDARTDHVLIPSGSSSGEATGDAVATRDGNAQVPRHRQGRQDRQSRGGAAAERRPAVGADLLVRGADPPVGGPERADRGRRRGEWRDLHEPQPRGVPAVGAGQAQGQSGRRLDSEHGHSALKK
jgi:hypothetical protein